MEVPLVRVGVRVRIMVRARVRARVRISVGLDHLLPHWVRVREPNCAVRLPTYHPLHREGHAGAHRPIAAR